MRRQVLSAFVKIHLSSCFNYKECQPGGPPKYACHMQLFSGGWPQGREAPARVRNRAQGACSACRHGAAPIGSGEKRPGPNQRAVLGGETTATLAPFGCPYALGIFIQTQRNPPC
jgi:hypothetical protein